MKQNFLVKFKAIYWVLKEILLSVLFVCACPWSAAASQSAATVHRPSRTRSSTQIPLLCLLPWPRSRLTVCAIPSVDWQVPPENFGATKCINKNFPNSVDSGTWQQKKSAERKITIPGDPEPQQPLVRWVSKGSGKIYDSGLRLDFKIQLKVFSFKVF